MCRKWVPGVVLLSVIAVPVADYWYARVTTFRFCRTSNFEEPIAEVTARATVHGLKISPSGDLMTANSSEEIWFSRRPHLLLGAYGCRAKMNGTVVASSRMVVF
jgi:hypothetical protein